MSKVAILTTFQEFNPGYSLTGIVADQAEMLSRYGHDVHIFVCEHFNDKYPFPDVAATVHKQIPFAHLTDYRSHEDLSDDHFTISQKTKEVLLAELHDAEHCFTHDYVFTGWNLPYCVGLRAASEELPHVNFLHWIHSIPSIKLDWWDVRAYTKNNHIIFPNEADRLLVAEQYRGSISDVRTIPHIKDLRTWFEFGEDTRAFIDDFPGVMQNDIVLIYPASSDRLQAKGIDKVVRILGAMKRLGVSVMGVVANQWATGRQPKQNIEDLKEIAVKSGLKVDEDFTFTSDWGIKNREKWDYENGIPRKMLRELFQCSNLFIFPTREESFGLVVPEATLSGGVFMVLNKSLRMMYEVGGMYTLFFDFGSFQQAFDPPDWDDYLHQVAVVILGRMQQNESIMSKTYARKRYNMDSLYREYYSRVMAETKIGGFRENRNR